jgi:hypothetical protein
LHNFFEDVQFNCMKKNDSEKLDQIITMLSDVVDVFGKRFDKIDVRFDKIERNMATKEQVLALHTQVKIENVGTDQYVKE